MKRPSLIATEDATVPCSSIVWIRPFCKMTSASRCGVFFLACAGPASIVPLVATAALAAALCMNLRREKPRCLRLSCVISVPSSVIDHFSIMVASVRR